MDLNEVVLMLGLCLKKRGFVTSYIVFSIIFLLIGAIIYFGYFQKSSDSAYILNTKSNTKTPKGGEDNNNFLNKFKGKLPSVKHVMPQSSKRTYENSYQISAKLYLKNGFEVKDKNIAIVGRPTFEFGNRIYSIQNPYIVNFYGKFENSGFSGNMEKIATKTDYLEIFSDFKSDYNSIEEIDVEDLDMDFENTNIRGTMKIKNKVYALDKAYLKMSGFSGIAKIVPDKNTICLEIDGNVGYLDMISNQIETILK